MSIYTKYIDEGHEAGLAGAECWENPYVQGHDEPTMTQAWHAGWCRGRQMANMKSLNLTRTEAEYLVEVMSKQNTGMAEELISQLVEVFGKTVLCVIDEPLDKS